MKIINLISGPRNLSTALMYSFAQREDTTVLDEPFYGYYLKNADLRNEHPSRNEILEDMELNQEKIVQAINSVSETPLVFVKGMAHHYLEEKPQFILNWENLFLIRHPKKLINSFSKVINSPTINDIGIKKEAELFSYLQANGKNPLVIDSDELLKNPEGYLSKICEALKISFTKGMLHWKKGGIPEDGIWAKHWYANVHDSEGFSPQEKNPEAFPIHLEPLLKKTMPYYEVLKKNILLNEE